MIDLSRVPTDPYYQTDNGAAYLGDSLELMTKPGTDWLCVCCTIALTIKRS